MVVIAIEVPSKVRLHMVLQDVLASDLKVVFCGTAAGNESARLAAYYAGPGNQFWATLTAIGLTFHRIEPKEFKNVLQHGIGLTDLSKEMSGADDVLQQGDFAVEELRKKIEDFRPAVLAFTSKKAAKVFLNKKKVEYGLQDDKIGETKIFVLPSPSARARKYWKISIWKELSEMLM
jgi:double-stranded uracil-DNA glycosylase